MSKIAIIAPHQDDEILACFHVIKKAIKENDEVKIVFVTNGDYFGKEAAKIRAEESYRILNDLGISNENIVFFGYGDTGMEKNISFLYRLYTFTDEKVLCTDNSSCTYHPLNKSTFHFALHEQEAEYTRACLKGDFYSFFDTVKPDKIYCPNSKDKHGDHAATHLFITEVLSELHKQSNYSPELYTYLIHISTPLARWPIRFGKYFFKPLTINKEDWGKRVRVESGFPKTENHQAIGYFKSQLPKKSFSNLYAFAKNEDIFFADNSFKQ